MSILTGAQILEAIKYNLDCIYYNPWVGGGYSTKSTHFAEDVASIQQDMGVKPDGKADKSVISYINAVYGQRLIPFGTHTIDPFLGTTLPRFVKRWGYIHLHQPDNPEWPIKDEGWHSLVNTDSWMAAMLRFVSGGSKDKMRYDRPIQSVITLDTISIGFDHTWAGTLPSRWSRMIELDKNNDLNTAIYNSEYCKYYDIRDTSHIRTKIIDLMPKERGKKSINFGSPAYKMALIWYQISIDPKVMALYSQAWVNTYVLQAIMEVKRLGWDHTEGRTIALVARMLNSAQVNLNRYSKAASKTMSIKDPIKTLEHIYNSPEMYNKPDRFKHVMGDADFRLPVNTEVSSIL